MDQWETRRQVPETDPVYQQERKNWQSSTSRDHFGSGGRSIYDTRTQTYGMTTSQIAGWESELAEIDDKESDRAKELAQTIQEKLEFAEKILKERGEFLRISFRRLAEDLSILLNQGGSEEREAYVIGEIQEMFAAPEIQDELKQHFGDDFSEFNSRNLLIKIIDGSISDELLYAAAEHHGKSICEQEVKLEKIVEETKAEFKAAVINEVANGLLPPEAAEGLHRIDSVVVNLSDRLSSITSSTVGEAGDTGKIKVSNEQLQERLIPRLKKTIIHELLHELSGKSVNIRTTNIDGRYNIHHIFHKKSGVVLNDENMLYGPNRWLNEAITEWLALKLSGYTGDTNEGAYKGSHSYTTEREELDRLFAAGLEERVVTNAYFENFSSDQPRETKGEHFVKLIQRVNDLEGPAGFAKLENKQIMHEIEYAMYRRHVYLAEDIVIQKDKVPSNVKIYYITINVGTSNHTINTKEFIYIAKPVVAGNTNITAADQWRQLETSLSRLEHKYAGKIKFSVAEE